MDKNTKDSFKPLVFIAIFVLLVLSMNKQCSNIIQKAASAQTEKMEIEKKQIMNLQKTR